MEASIKKPQVPTLYMGIGVPGAGKTTYLRKLEKEYELLRIDADEIRQWLFNDPHNHQFNPDIWSIIHTSIKVALKAGRSVIVDAINLAPDYRKSEVNMYRDFGAIRVVGIVFETPLKECLKRNAERDRKVSEEYIRKCFNDLELFPPDMTEGFDEFVRISN